MLKLHEFILRNIDDNSAGDFRRINVGIRGTEFVPIPAILVEDEIDKLFYWYDHNKNKMYFIELLAKFHQKFEEIHPFSDGNGRVGRELVRLILKQHGFPSIFIGPKNREEYLESLDKSNRENYKPIIHFFIKYLLNMNEKLVNNAKVEIVESLEKDGYTKLKQTLLNKEFKKIKLKLTQIKFVNDT
jgi:Fic family protein